MGKDVSAKHPKNVGNQSFRKTSPAEVMLSKERGNSMECPANIIHVLTMENFVLSVLFADGERKLYDLKPLFEMPSSLYSPIKNNPQMFSKASINHNGAEIFWDENISISNSELYNNGVSTSNDNEPQVAIIKIEALDNLMLLVTFDNGQKRLYDFKWLNTRFPDEVAVFQKNPEFFKQVKIRSGGNGIYWNEDIDISEWELYDIGINITTS